MWRVFNNKNNKPQTHNIHYVGLIFYPFCCFLIQIHKHIWTNENVFFLGSQEKHILKLHSVTHVLLYHINQLIVTIENYFKTIIFSAIQE